MLDLKLILQNPELVKTNLANQGFDTQKIDQIVALGLERSAAMSNLQQLEAKRNALSKTIGQLKTQNQAVTSVMEEVGILKNAIHAAKAKEQAINAELKAELLLIPNLTTTGVPYGLDETANQVLQKHATLGRGLVKNVKSNEEISQELDLVDFQRAVKLAGTRFWAYKGLGAQLVRALENFMLDRHIIKNHYLEWIPPVMVRSTMMQGTGQLPKFAHDAFKIANRDAYLISTAEVPLTNLHHNEIIDLTQPLAYTAFTPCFRAEAGAGGKDMRGLIRAHQFHKVELVKFVRKEDVSAAFKGMLEDAKGILEALELPYQEVLLCSGDIGFAAEKTIDLEVWIPSEQKFREISSVSSMGNFQGRRASIRYKDNQGQSQYAYTMNGSALAVDRTVAAILENYQNPDGSITIPQVLRPYMHNLTIITKEHYEHKSN